MQSSIPSSSTCDPTWVRVRLIFIILFFRSGTRKRKSSAINSLPRIFLIFLPMLRIYVIKSSSKDHDWSNLRQTTPFFSSLRLSYPTWNIWRWFMMWIFGSVWSEKGEKKLEINTHTSERETWRMKKEKRNATQGFSSHWTTVLDSVV